MARNNWSVDPAIVIQEVTAYNIALCQRNGWNEYLSGGGEGSVPFTIAPPPTVLQRAKNLAAGAAVSLDWIANDSEAVPQESANHRAEVCVKCPFNGKGGWERWFTIPISNAVHALIEKKNGMNLRTPLDDKLGVCEICTCPLEAKVWMKVDKILAKLQPDVKARLHPDCWILDEGKRL